MCNLQQTFKYEYVSSLEQMEKCAHRRNVFLGIIKINYNIVKISPLMLTVGISM